MKKVVLLFLSCLVVNTICMAGRPINLTCSIIDPSAIGHQTHKAPPKNAVVYLEDYTLSFDAFEEDCVIKLLDGDGVVYEVDIPAGSTSVVLPSTFSGEYILQLFKGNWVFEGEIGL